MENYNIIHTNLTTQNPHLIHIKDQSPLLKLD